VSAIRLTMSWPRDKILLAALLIFALLCKSIMLWLFTRRKCLTFLNRALSLWFLFYLIPILCNYASIYLLYIIYYIYQGRPNGRSQTISKLIVLEFIFRLRTRKLIMMVVNNIKLFYGSRSSKVKYIFSRSRLKKLWPPLIYMVFY
jgi:hypothetical protein